VSEFEVLITTIRWLVNDHWDIQALSIAKGQGLPSIIHQEKTIREKFCAEGIEINQIIFKPKGPDIIARKGGIEWRIECKGLGQGTPQTHRNNFDRAIASAVSYFDDPKIRLGLALANDYLWKYNFTQRLPQTLREATNLWVFLLENETIYPYGPEEELPFPRAI